MVPDGHSVRVPVMLMDSAQREVAGRYRAQTHAPKPSACGMRLMP